MKHTTTTDFSTSLLPQHRRTAIRRHLKRSRSRADRREVRLALKLLM